MKSPIEKITDDFLTSYQDVGGINHIAGPNLPSRQGIENIIQDLERLVFPGFKAEEAIETANLQFNIAETANRLIRNLTQEITRSVCFRRRINGDSDCIHKYSNSVSTRCRSESEDLALEIVSLIPGLRDRFKKDVEAAFGGDPASKSHEEVILSYPGVEAIVIHRIAHLFYERDIPLIPRMMSEIIHGKTGVDIHPGATIGDYFFIDHATGVVIGETCIIGNNVKIYQGVTLGALSVKKEEANIKRHPTIEDDVTIYAGATILGGKTTVGRGSIIGGNVWLTKSVPAGSRIMNKGVDYIIKNNYEHVPDFQI